MKTLLVGSLLLGLSLSAQAVTRADLDARLRSFATKFDAMQSKPDKRIPAQLLRQAHGIILVQQSRGGLIVGYQGGNGIAMVREPGTGNWGPPIFLTVNEGTFGAQVGGQTSFMVILLMNGNVNNLIAEAQTGFGQELRGTAGNESTGQRFNNTPPGQQVLIYSDTSGLYGGAIAKTGGLSPDADAEAAYYGQYLTPGEILPGQRVKPTQASSYLADTINKFSK